MVRDKEELQSRADDFMEQLSDDSDHVKSYFKHPKLKEYDDFED